MEKQQSNIPKLRFPEFKGDWEKNYLGVPLSGRADLRSQVSYKQHLVAYTHLCSNLFFVPQKRISTTIPNAKNYTP